MTTGEKVHQESPKLKQAIKVEQQLAGQTLSKEELEIIQRHRKTQEDLKEYHKRRSSQETVENLKQAEQLLIQQIKDIELKPAIAAAGGNGQYATPQQQLVMYLFPELAQDTQKAEALFALMDANPGVAGALHTLLTSDRSVHGSSDALQEVGQRLYAEAHRASGAYPAAIEAIKPVLDAIERKAKSLIIDEFLRDRETGDERQFRRAVAKLANKLGLDEKDLELARLINLPPQDFEQTLQNKLKEIPFYHTPKPDREEASWVKEAFGEIPAGITPSKDGTVSILNIRDDLLAKERNPDYKPTLKDLETAQNKLNQAESEAYKKDVIPGSAGYVDAVNQINEWTKEVRKKLANKYNERLLEQGPDPKHGEWSKEEFLQNYRVGHFADFLRYSPEAREMLIGDSEESVDFRKKMFLKIHTGVLSRKYTQSREAFGLFEQSDFTTFLGLLQEMPAVEDTKTGQTVGQRWMNYYTNLSDTIMISRDMDYTASQPGATIQDLNKHLALWQNAHALVAMQIPAVEQARRCLETTLSSLKTNFDGYIMPDLVEYNPAFGGTVWDTRAQQMLEGWIEKGVVYDVERDKHGFHEVEEDGHTLRLKETSLKPKDIDPLELSLYMTLAKGFGMGTLRWLEMFAHSRVPGSENPITGAPGFHSIAGYEGCAMALNYIGLMVEKFKMGFHSYWHMMNLLIPEHEKVDIDANEGVQVYIAYRDGTLAKKRPHLKRLLDLANPSSASSALGPQGTRWRYYDSTINWTDKMLENLGGPVRIMLSKKYAEDRVMKLFVTTKYQLDYLVRTQIPEKYYQDTKGKKIKYLSSQKALEIIADENRRRKSAGEPMLSINDPWFASKWQQEGEGNYQYEIYHEQLKYEGKTDKGDVKHTKEKHEFETLRDAYKHAFIARVWVETAMRNPLAVAHNLDIEVPNKGFENDPDPDKWTKTVKLHDLIVQEVLGIRPEDLKYGTVVEMEDDGQGGKRAVIKMTGAKYMALTETQRKYLDNIFDLEADLAAVREEAIRLGRDLTDRDFANIIKDEVRLEHAHKYWRLCRRAILGTEDLNEAERLYDAFGLTFKDKQVLGYYDVDWHKVQNIDKTLDSIHQRQAPMIHTSYGDIRLPVVMGVDLVKKDWDWVFGTDDLDLRKAGLENLGSRHWFRRGGDMNGHFQGGQKFAEYLTLLSRSPKLEKKEAVKILSELVLAYSIDDWYPAAKVAGMLVSGTMKMYSFDINYLGSYAQKHIWKRHMGVDCWFANDRWEFGHDVMDGNILPPHGSDFWIGEYCPYNVHELERVLHASTKDVIIEMLLFGAGAFLILTLIRGFTAKDEEEER